MLEWPISSFGFFHNILQKNPDELFGQPNTLFPFRVYIALLSVVLLIGLRPWFATSHDYSHPTTHPQDICNVWKVLVVTTGRGASRGQVRVWSSHSVLSRPLREVNLIPDAWCGSWGRVESFEAGALPWTGPQPCLCPGSRPLATWLSLWYSREQEVLNFALLFPWQLEPLLSSGEGIRDRESWWHGL